MSSTSQAIVARNLTKRFGEFTAVDAISFEVGRGEIFGFLGANGAGKTTAIKMLCGLSRPTAGEATIAGFDIYRQPEAIKRSIGYMSQHVALYQDMTIWENIRFYAGIYGLSAAAIRERGEKLLDELKLQKYADRMLSDLPLGWKQKLAFSVAIIHEPRIVFLDEPTSGVDPITRRQFWGLIYAASERGITVFVTTHYLEEAEYCHRVSIMVEGRMQALDTPVALMRQHRKRTMNEVFLHFARHNATADTP